MIKFWDEDALSKEKAKFFLLLSNSAQPSFRVHCRSDAQKKYFIKKYIILFCWWWWLFIVVDILFYCIFYIILLC